MTTEEAIEILEERWRYSRTYKYTDAEIREAFDMAIKALEQEPKTGKWERYVNDYKICSKCEAIVKSYHNYKYCPACGAKMKEEKNED